jgi:membrane protein DedA with SNARE-associated domain
MDAQFFYDVVAQYGLYAVFFLAMIEGDITLLLAGVLAHSAFFGEYSFLKVLTAGTLGGAAGDNVAYFMGRTFHHGVSRFRGYSAVHPRIKRLSQKFGALSIFLSKYIYGLRTGSCIFYGVSRMPYARFLPLTFGSCFIWVLLLSGAGYFFSGIVINLIGDFHRLGAYLLIIVVVGIVGFYLVERYWLSEKVESANPEKIQELEQAAQEKLHELQERLPLPRHKERKKE